MREVVEDLAGGSGEPWVVGRLIAVPARDQERSGPWHMGFERPDSDPPAPGHERSGSGRTRRVGNGGSARNRGVGVVGHG